MGIKYGIAMSSSSQFLANFMRAPQCNCDTHHLDFEARCQEATGARAPVASSSYMQLWSLLRWPRLNFCNQKFRQEPSRIEVVTLSLLCNHHAAGYFQPAAIGVET